MKAAKAARLALLVFALWSNALTSALLYLIWLWHHV